MIHHAITQFYLRVGQKKIRNEGRTTVSKELQKLYDLKSFATMNAEDLTTDKN